MDQRDFPASGDSFADKFTFIINLEGCNLNSKIINWREADDSQIVCHCKGIDKGTILRAIRDNPGCRKLDCLMRKTGAGTGNECAEKNPLGRCCKIDLQKIIFIESGEVVPHKECCGSGCCG